MNVHEQVAKALATGPIPAPPKRVLVVGCSTGYGLASRIVTAFGGGADTIGVSFEREPGETRTASAGWYNNRAFEAEARAAGRKAITLDGDGFSTAMKDDVVASIRAELGQIDMLVYSMAAPARTDPETGETFRSAIKPLGAPVHVKTLNTDTGEVYDTELAPATEAEAAATVKVMGGEDWELWIDTLERAGVLAPGFRTLSYTYIGSELTWPIYWKATLGKAKEDLDRAAAVIRARLGDDAARVVALKAVVTQASAAIPLVPLYGVLLIRVMNEMGLGEGCLEQIDRLFREVLPRGALDDAGRLRVDDWELSTPVQNEVKRRWALATTETLGELGDLPGYKREFLRLFGFGLDGVDYELDVDPTVTPALA
jgi:enoyl-[acyl-carrier protein] reductase / trans-2-enoyl-CoA reductase (NAD+)